MCISLLCKKDQILSLIAHRRQADLYEKTSKEFMDQAKTNDAEENDNIKYFDQLREKTRIYISSTAVWSTYSVYLNNSERSDETALLKATLMKDTRGKHTYKYL